MSCERALNWINEKCFPKTISQWEFDYSLFTKNDCGKNDCDFSPSSFKLKEVSCLSSQNMYPNLKTTCHIKVKFFLWTKLLEKLFLAKHLISAAATLNDGLDKLFCRMRGKCYIWNINVPIFFENIILSL